MTREKLAVMVMQALSDPYVQPFQSATAAEHFRNQCFTFKGIEGRKVSAAITRCKPEASTYRGRW